MTVMARLLYSAAMSVDGFIAGPGGDMGWLSEHLGPNPLVDDLVPLIGSLLVGARTYGGDDPYKDTPAEGEAFGGAWSGPQVVLTHRVLPERPGVTFADDLTTAVRLASDAAGDRYVNVLGADVARQCIAAGLLDEVLVTVVPVLLGGGTRLFDAPALGPVRLGRLQVDEAADGTNLWFRVLRG